MKGFQKLALVSAIAALPMTGFAMEALDDAALSDVSGQDGISIGLNLNQTMNILIDDTDGLDVATGLGAFDRSGGILITGMTINGSAQVDIDAGGNGAGAGVLVVNVSLGEVGAAGNNFVINTGAISAVDTNDAGDGTFTASANVILPSTEITIDGLDLEIQLGSGAVSFMRLAGDLGTITFGEEGNAANNFQINDVAGGGDIRMDELAISGLDVTGTTVSATGAGLVITTGGSLTAIGVTMKGLSLDGGTNNVGDIYITGLNMAANTITINGK